MEQEIVTERVNGIRLNGVLVKAGVNSWINACAEDRNAMRYCKSMQLCSTLRRHTRRIGHLFSNGDDMHTMTHKSCNFRDGVAESRAGGLNRDLWSAPCDHSSDLAAERQAKIPLKPNRSPQVQAGALRTSSVRAHKRQSLFFQH